MKNVERAWPEFEIEFGGEKYLILCNLRVFRDFQLATGKNPWSGDTWRDMGPIETVALIWAALRKHRPKLTLDDIAEEALPDELSIAGRILSEYIKSSIAEADEKNAKTPKN